MAAGKRTAAKPDTSADDLGDIDMASLGLDDIDVGDLTGGVSQDDLNGAIGDIDIESLSETAQASADDDVQAILDSLAEVQKQVADLGSDVKQQGAVLASIAKAIAKLVPALEKQSEQLHALSAAAAQFQVPKAGAAENSKPSGLPHPSKMDAKPSPEARADEAMVQVVKGQIMRLPVKSNVSATKLANSLLASQGFKAKFPHSTADGLMEIFQALGVTSKLQDGSVVVVRSADFK